MLSPEMFDDLADDVLELYTQLDEAIVRDIVRRLVKTGGVSLTAAWQAERLQESGLLYDDIIRRVAKMSDASESLVRACFEDVAIEALDFDIAIYRAAGLSPLPLRQSPAAARVLQAMLQKTNGHLRNLSLTTAATSQQAYISAVTAAEMQVESGAIDYVTAIRNAVRDAARAGTTVMYPTGHHDQLDVAVRRAVLTGASQTAAQISMRYADELGCDLVETTAHPEARPEHQVWQGKVFSRAGQSSKYPPFEASTGYGTGGGLCGWNCRHSFYPFFENLSADVYPRDKLQEYANRTVEFDGQTISYYEATQMQREMERAIRATKRELVGYDEGIKSTDSEELRAALNAWYGKASAKLKQRERKLNDFSRQTGLMKQHNRQQVLGFGRSQAQRAVQANKRIAIQKQTAIIEEAIKKETGLYGDIHISPRKIDIEALVFDEKHTRHKHDVTEQDAKDFIRTAIVSVTRWEGKAESYYSKQGAAYVDLESMTIRTAFRADEYDLKIKALMEAIKKYGK